MQTEQGTRAPVPKISDDQRREYLQRAMVTRKQASEAKDKVRSGEVSLEEALTTRLDEYGRVRVSHLLCCLEGIGPAKASAMMERIGIAPNRKVMGLGKRQREALIEELRDRPGAHQGTARP